MTVESGEIKSPGGAGSESLEPCRELWDGILNYFGEKAVYFLNISLTVSMNSGDLRLETECSVLSDIFTMRPFLFE